MNFKVVTTPEALQNVWLFDNERGRIQEPGCGVAPPLPPASSTLHELSQA